MVTPLISVVMPAYNAGKTIHRAIDSVLGQTYTNFELIIVNDGSKDDTYNICLQYKDSRIRLFTQDNRGASSTRNRALDLCGGDYLTFIDSDDWYEPDFLERLFLGVKNSDLCVCGMAFHGKDIQTMNPAIAHYDHLMANSDFLQTFETGVMNSTCNKLYKLSIIQHYNIRFPDAKIGEDYLFNLEYLQHIESVNYISEVLYHYDNTQSTLTRQVSEDMFQTYYKTQLLMEQMFDKDLHDIVARIIYPQYCSLIIRYLQSVLHGKLRKIDVLPLLKQQLQHHLVKKAIRKYQPCSKYDALVQTLLKNNALQLLILVLRLVNMRR